jgi:hypothetical protein
MNRLVERIRIHGGSSKIRAADMTGVALALSAVKVAHLLGKSPENSS